ncbi:substrate-binding domain-containing protein [Catellatospora tritici]|uniref:substrate-binding domain-containing protein n=1 Tax=Catellatospora tritici TaxID=2851566 RepID=UPI001C2D17A0|nr:substrate-binding domain-containing protein [Catellatospora tritici]MBV1852117.1 substrate-binding and VWA domain-containing protein [Catellatospora tritici]
MIIIGALSLCGVATVVLKSVSADADGCGSGGINLTVAADPSVAPAITEIGARWTATNPTIGQDCIRVDVMSKPAYELANSLGTWAGGQVDVADQPAPTPNDSDLPAVWIPDSSYWLGRVRAVDRDIFEAESPSVAASPIVLAVPETAARQLSAQLAKGVDPAMLKGLLSGDHSPLKLGVVEPRRDTAGMVGAMMLAQAVVASEADLPELVQSFRGIGGPVADTVELWKQFGKGVTGAPVSEQAVVTFNATGPAAPMAAINLAGAPTLDFPFAVRARQPRPVVTAATMFREALTSGDYAGIFAKRGLRKPDGTASTGFPVGHGVSSSSVFVQPLNDMNQVRSVLTVWIAAKTPSRVIALVDVTSSMNRTMTGNGNTAPRMQVMRSAAEDGLKLFTDDSEVGLWAFAGPGHQPVVPLAKLSKSQRSMLNGAVHGAQPAFTDVCPLYKAIIDGYKAMVQGYDPMRSNTLVVFTDGKDNTGMQLRAMQKELEKLADVTRPVRVVLLGLGPDVKLADLQAIAATTGGAAFQVSDPKQMRSIFLKALLA